MAKFSISVSIEVDADNYEEAYEIEKNLTEFLNCHYEVNNVYSIDVEQTSNDEEEEAE